MAHLDREHLAILKALHGRKLNGYRITKQIQANGGDEVPIATLYVKLAELERFGLVKHITRDDKRMIFSLVGTKHKPGDRVRLNVLGSHHNGRVFEVLEASPGGFLGDGHHPGYAYKVEIDNDTFFLTEDQALGVDDGIA